MTNKFAPYKFLSNRGFFDKLFNKRHVIPYLDVRDDSLPLS